MYNKSIATSKQTTIPHTYTLEKHIGLARPVLNYSAKSPCLGGRRRTDEKEKKGEKTVCEREGGQMAPNFAKTFSSPFLLFRAKGRDITVAAYRKRKGERMGDFLYSAKYNFWLGN